MKTLAGTAQHHRDRRRRGRRRAGAGDRPSAARGRQGGQPAGHARHQGRDPGRPGRGGAPQAARDLPAPRHPAARARAAPSASSAARSSSRTANGSRPTRCSSSPRRAPRRGSPTPACRSTSSGFLAVDDTLRLDRRSADLRRRRLRHRAEPSPAQGRRVRGAPGPAARRQSAARAAAAQAPQPFVPQRRYLSILGTGDGRAVATRGDVGDRRAMGVVVEGPHRSQVDADVSLAVSQPLRCFALTVRIIQGTTDKWQRTPSSTRSRTPSCAPSWRS